MWSGIWQKKGRSRPHLIEEAEVHVGETQLALQLLRQVLQLLLLRQGCYLLGCNPSNALRAQIPWHDCIMATSSVSLDSTALMISEPRAGTPVSRQQMKYLVKVARQAELQGQGLGLSLQGGLL